MVGWRVSILIIVISWYSWRPRSSQLKCFSFRESCGTMERRRLWVETTPAVPCERQNCWIWVMSREGCVFNMAQKALRWLATVGFICLGLQWIQESVWLRCWDAFSDLAGLVWVSQMYLQSYGPGSKGPQNGFTVSHDAYAFSSWSHFRKQGVGWVHQAVLRRDKRRDRQADSAGHVKAARRPWTNPFKAPYRSDAWMGVFTNKTCNACKIRQNMIKHGKASLGSE